MLWAEKHLSIHNTSFRQMELQEKWKFTLGYTHVSQGKKSETAAAKNSPKSEFLYEETD